MISRRSFYENIQLFTGERFHAVKLLRGYQELNLIMNFKYKIHISELNSKSCVNIAI